jgi:hypothetical protein
MGHDARQTAGSAVRLTLTVLGLGLLVSVVVGLLVGWIIGDLARGLGRSVAIGMSISAVLGVAATILSRRR